MQITLVGGWVNPGSPHPTAASSQWLRNLPTTFILKTDLSVMQKLPVPAWRCLPVAQQSLLHHRCLVLHYKLSPAEALEHTGMRVQSLPFPWKDA